MHTVPPKSLKCNAPGKTKAQDLRDRIDASLDVLAKAVDEVRASEAFRQFLNVQSRFHRYSWHNTLLIASQRPDATRVAGYKTWQGFGRQVRKGERGIAIIAPCHYKRELESTDDGERETVEGLYFRVVHVFDITQTDGQALPMLDVPNVEAAADDLLTKLVRVGEGRSIRVEFKTIDTGAFGYSEHGKVSIDTGHATGQQAKTLAHELAHEALHWEDRGSFTRSIAELEAESVAYVVCTHFGLDVEVRASRYIALWQGDSKSLRASLERISKTAREIIDETESLVTRKAVA